jgi:hypothetical protein
MHKFWWDVQQNHLRVRIFPFGCMHACMDDYTLLLLQ